MGRIIINGSVESEFNPTYKSLLVQELKMEAAHCRSLELGQALDLAAEIEDLMNEGPAYVKALDVAHSTVCAYTRSIIG